jgi:hypothetical protein
VTLQFNFEKLITSANGMLPTSVYIAISEAAANAKADVLEVGTAHGASAIAAAKGLSEHLLVKTIDRLQGGSRELYGDIKQNAAMVNANFIEFGVEDRIQLFIGSSEEVAPTLKFDNGIGMLILDADGAIDRDFRLYYNLLKPGAPIVIDDYHASSVNVMRSLNGHCVIDQKHRLTALFIDYFEAKGLLIRDKVIKETYFGVKPENKNVDVTFDLDDFILIYRQLTFGKGKSRPTFILKGLEGLKSAAPKIYLTLKKIFRPRNL